jgi:CheY-like chemotaxis protein
VKYLDMRNEITASRQKLPPWRILIVEDEALISLLIETMLSDLGHEAVARAFNVPTALALVNERPHFIDAALLDVNLGGHLVFPVADALMNHQIPFAFLTGYGPAGIPPRYAHATTMPKPFREKDVAYAVETLQRARYEALGHRPG